MYFTAFSIYSSSIKSTSLSFTVLRNILFISDNLITNQFYNFNNCAEFCERFGFVREAVTRVLSGKLNMHHNCIFVKIETNSHDAYMKLLDKAKILFVKYPKLAEQNKQYLESKNENS